MCWCRLLAYVRGRLNTDVEHWSLTVDWFITIPLDWHEWLAKLQLTDVIKSVRNNIGRLYQTEKTILCLHNIPQFSIVFIIALIQCTLF